MAATLPATCLRSIVRSLLAALESRWSGRLFAIGMVAGTIFALATWTPPFLPLVCLILWPALSAVICGFYLAIEFIEGRILNALGLAVALALHLLFVFTAGWAVLLLAYPDWFMSRFWPQ